MRRRRSCLAGRRLGERGGGYHQWTAASAAAGGAVQAGADGRPLQRAVQAVHQLALEPLGRQAARVEGLRDLRLERTLAGGLAGHFLISMLPFGIDSGSWPDFWFAGTMTVCVIMASH